MRRNARYLLRDDGWLEEGGTSVNVAGEVASLAPPGDIHKVHNDRPQTAISLHIYGTDVSRVGSSVRRVYDLPVLAGNLGRVAGLRPAIRVAARGLGPYSAADELLSG
jgi:hypothetical protein